MATIVQSKKMTKRVNIFAILTFYIIAISLRYLSNKTGLLEGLPSNFLKVILQGISPAIGAVVVFYIFNLKPTLSLKGNYRETSTPFLLYWAINLTCSTFLNLGTFIDHQKKPIEYSQNEPIA